jgi:ABC-type multidrug transport system fused ATPase/permease subunit
LQDVSFTLQPGAVTALVGPSGAGKTTAADLLLRLFDLSGGDILLDGARLSELDAAAVRREIAVVAADGAIFRASLADNIRYMRPAADDQDVLAAISAAGLTRLVDRLPQGIATEIGERGVGLSVGERQRLQIARALVARPRILILDEATANLDYATEKDIRTALLHAPNRPTTLVIAHRYSMVEAADHVIVLDGGKVVDQGTPGELIARNRWFAEFAASAGEEAPSPAASGGDDTDEDPEDDDVDDTSAVRI